MNFVRKMYDWMGKKVDSPWSMLWLIIFFFVEASFFIIPVDPLLILYCVSNIRKSYHYAAISTISSVAGGILGYTIGALMWNSTGAFLVKWIISEKVFSNIVIKYRFYQHWAVLIAGFTPIPYKAVTISAGFCNLAFLPFIFYSFVARGLRFFLIASLITVWGEQSKIFIDRHLNKLAVLFLFLIILSLSVLL